MTLFTWTAGQRITGENWNTLITTVQSLVDTPPGATTITNDNFLGSECAGNDGEQNRTLTIDVNTFIVSLDGRILVKDVDYSISGTTLTLLVDVWNEQKIGTWNT